MNIREAVTRAGDRLRGSIMPTDVQAAIPILELGADFAAGVDAAGPPPCPLWLWSILERLSDQYGVPPLIAAAVSGVLCHYAPDSPDGILGKPSPEGRPAVDQLVQRDPRAVQLLDADLHAGLAALGDARVRMGSWPAALADYTGSRERAGEVVGAALLAALRAAKG